MERFAAADVSRLKPTRRSQSELTFAATALNAALAGRILRRAGTMLMVVALLVTQTGLGAEAICSSSDNPPNEPLRLALQPAVDDAFIQAELSRVGGLMAERGELLPRAELLRHRLPPTLTLPQPATTPCGDAELAAKCQAAVVVVARLARLGASNSWVAVPASGFFISTNGAFVTSSHVIHNPDYDGIIVLTGDGRVFPVRALLADDETNDVAILQATGDAVSALALETAVEAGSRIAVMSHPVGRFFTFTQGAVTRRSLQHRGTHAQELLEISAEFGPGSSGAPVVNSRGNVVGWADTLTVWPGHANRDPGNSPKLNFRECGVAADVLRLVHPLEVGAK